MPRLALLALLALAPLAVAAERLPDKVPALRVALAAPPAPPAPPMAARLGEALFGKLWVPAPASTRASDGLGPLYNARSCQSCHAAAGRGRMTPGAAEPGPALVLHLGRDGRPDPRYGRQIQTRAIPGQQAEARLLLEWQAEDALRRPRPVLTLADGPLDPGTAGSLRLAPPLHGLGGLETVPEAAILALADPEDADGDGISGRPNRGPDGRIGRFGHKAGAPDLPDFIATAFAADIGIGSPLRSGAAGDCTPAQAHCRSAPGGGSPAQDGEEIGAEGIALVAAYLRTLPRTERPMADPVPTDPAGVAIFAGLGCPACHVPALPGPAGPVAAYTDLLLHDMGEGLADALAEGEAQGFEWRTAPLLAGGTGPFLHDGRAATLAEAVLWHGGEATPARDRFAALSAAERATLTRFLEGL